MPVELDLRNINSNNLDHIKILDDVNKKVSNFKLNVEKLCSGEQCNS